MPLLLLLLCLIGIPRSPTAEAKLQEAGARELAHQMQTDERFQRGRTLAQGVAHYRIAVADYLRTHEGALPEFADLVNDGYLLSWVTDGNVNGPIKTTPGDTRNFRLILDGALPELTYLSYGLEHPEGEGAWTESHKWISTNIEHLTNMMGAQSIDWEQRKRGLEIQLAAPIELSYIFTRKMPATYAVACSISQLAPLNTVPDDLELTGLSLWVQPTGNRYAVVWTDAEGVQAADVYGFPPDMIDSKHIGNDLGDDFVQIWPPPEGAPAPASVGALRLIEQMSQTLPKNEGDPGLIDIKPWRP